MKHLKTNIYQDIKRKPLITKVSQAANISEQSIRLWSKKKDIRLLAYPIMIVLCEHYECNIQDLFETV